jgi:hypothetical protein
MKKSFLALGLAFVCAIMAQAQQASGQSSVEGSSQASGALNQGGQAVNLESGTRVAGQLQGAIDARNAKVGDRVVLKTTQAIKSEGRTVVGKGARLIGHVTEVARKGKSGSESRLGLLFDRLENGSLAMPITATITSITSSQSSVRAGDDDMFATSAGGSTRTASSGSASSGGLLGVGGVVNSTTSTVGSAVGGTTSAVGSTVNSTTNTVGGATSGLGRSLSRVRISESSSTSVEGGSVLSLQGDNLRLEKGTNFNLVLTQSASAGARDQ